MKIRTLVVDANYLFKRSFHGNKETYTSKGKHIGGLYSFYITLRKLIKDYHVNKIVLIWDGQNGGILRYNIDKQYKANHENKNWNEKLILTNKQVKKELDKDESVLWQRERIKEYAEELFIRQIEICDIEGDDLVAAYCQQYNNKEEIFLFTNDRDFLQLLNLNISIIFANISQPITKNNFYFTFDYHYANAIIMKIICGDKGDNVKGIQGMGEGTLLKYFPELKSKPLTVREICIIAKEINKERILYKKKPVMALENLLNNIDRLKMNYQLVSLKEPLLNDEAREALEQLEYPLSPVGRGSKNLLKLMTEDEMLLIYKGNFVNYVEPFYTVIQNERDLFNEYERNLKRNI
jgi:5'-3' exonuclease